MKRLVRFLVAELIILSVGYGVLAITGWLMSLSIPIPLLIIMFCFLMYRTLRREI